MGVEPRYYYKEMPKLIYITREYLSRQPFPLAMLRPMEAGQYLKYRKQWQHPILDIGCGDGFFAGNLFGKKGVDVGVDVNGNILLKADRSGAYKKTLKFDGIQLPFPREEFKTVTANCVLEHVDHPRLLLREISRITASQGLLLFTVPTTNFERMLLGFLLFKILNWDKMAKTYAGFMNRVTRQKYYWTSKKWRSVLRQYGFAIIDSQEFFSQRAMGIFDLTHWLSIPSILTKLLLGRWVLFNNSPMKNRLLNKLRIWSLRPDSQFRAFQFFACLKT